MAKDQFGYGTEGNMSVMSLLDSDEMREWITTPFDEKTDPDRINSFIQTFHKEQSEDLDTWWVPRSSANEAATDGVLNFLKVLQDNKPGIPRMTGIRDQKVIFGDE